MVKFGYSSSKKETINSMYSARNNAKWRDGKLDYHFSFENDSTNVSDLQALKNTLPSVKFSSFKEIFLDDFTKISKNWKFSAMKKAYKDTKSVFFNGKELHKNNFTFIDSKSEYLYIQDLESFCNKLNRKNIVEYINRLKTFEEFNIDSISLYTIELLEDSYILVEMDLKMKSLVSISFKNKKEQEKLDAIQKEKTEQNKVA